MIISALQKSWMNFNKLYFNNELIKKNIKEIKIIHKKLNKIEIKQLRFFNE